MPSLSSQVATSVTDNKIEDENEGLQRMSESNDSLSTNKKQSSQKLKPVSTQALREYLFCMWKQYKVVGKHQKDLLLNEMERNLTLHRKALIRLMNKPWAPRLQRGERATGRTVEHDGLYVRGAHESGIAGMDSVPAVQRLF